MTLSVPPLPPILAGHSIKLYRKWFAFWSLPLEKKADIVDEYSDLIIERATSPETQSMDGPKVRVFFEPAVLDYKIPDSAVFRFWEAVKYHDGFFPTQAWHALRKPFNEMDYEAQRCYLFCALTPLNFALAAYRHRYTIRPENYYFGMDFENDLMNAYTVDELLTFYDPQSVS